MSQNKDEQDGEKHEQNPEEMALTERGNEETKEKKKKGAWQG